MGQADVLVIGGGLVGCAIAYGLARRGTRVLVLDGSDHDFRASKANFGLVWVQGKGKGLPAYQAWTRQSSDGWSDFAAELEALTGIGLCYERTGGLTFCVGTEEYEMRAAEIDGLRHEGNASDYDTRMLDRKESEQVLGGLQLGPQVTGASYCWRDAHVNPLLLLTALQKAIEFLGGQVLVGRKVVSAEKAGSGIAVVTASERYHAPKVVIAAGVASAEVATYFGMNIPVRPQRGQILVTERIAPLLNMPTVPIRQTAEGTILIGSTQEEVGPDIRTTADAAARMAARAVAILPILRTSVVVRQWSGLRIMSPDVAPIYAQAPGFPGVYVATCHSAVTLAAAHTNILAEAIANDSIERNFTSFHPGRFDVSKAA